MKFLVFYEKAPNNYCAFVPNLPVVCLSAGDIVDEVQQNIREAMDSPLELMAMDGDPIVEPLLWYEELDICAQQKEGSPLKYMAAFENSPTNNAGYCPELPGCWSIGDTPGEVRENLRQLIRIRLGEAPREGRTLP